MYSEHQNESQQPMKTEQIPSSSPVLATDLKNDHSKLVSLLALAAGAVAMPQTSNADIIYTESGATVSVDGSSAFNTGNSAAGKLPGNVQFGFNALRYGLPYVDSARYITGGKRGSGYLKFKSALAPQSMVWGQINASLLSNALFGSAASSHNSGGLSPGFLAFEFKDSTQAGSPMRYGWVGISLANGNLSSGNDFPMLTVSGWAYDDSGAPIPMGATASVPEPSAAALLALGALTLGAAGVRSWRRNRAAASRS